MRIAFTEEQEQFRRELHAYFASLVSSEVRRALSGDEGGPATIAAYKQIVAQMGRDGWLGIGWPKEYGGQGRSRVEQMVFISEAASAGLAIGHLAINTVGPTIALLGTDEQKEEFLPRILQGLVHFSIGYSEPDAGTDLARLKTRAVRDGDEYVINGQKLWTSRIEYADYVWLACRTDPEAPRHQGLSVVIVPTSSAGFSWSPVPTVGGANTSATFYEDVRVPVKNLVGEENQGWRIITNQLNWERVGFFPATGVSQSLAEVRAWAQSTELPDGRRVIDQEWVQINLAEVHAKVEFLKLMNWKIASGAGKGSNPAESSVNKVFASEFYIEAYRLLMECFGPESCVQTGSPGAKLRGGIERAARGVLINTFGAGTNEVQRDIIATVGLGMPRAPR